MVPLLWWLLKVGPLPAWGDAFLPMDTLRDEYACVDTPRLYGSQKSWADRLFVLMQWRQRLHKQ